jgi:WD40 repeat protein
MLAVGGHSISEVEILNVQGSKLAKKSFIEAKIDNKIQNCVTHLDWSCESGLLALNFEASELKYTAISHRKGTLATTSVKDVKWYTWTCTFGPPVQGTTTNSDGKHLLSACRSRNQTLVATSDEFGRVNLFRYPCIDQKSNPKSYKGHCSGVTKVRFLDNDNYCVSTGGHDKSIILWETDVNSSKTQTDKKQHGTDLLGIFNHPSGAKQHR